MGISTIRISHPILKRGKELRVSEKSLELNVGAELLDIFRNSWGLQKTYLRGLTQKEEAAEGADFFAQLCPCSHIAAFQFKAPSINKARAPNGSFPFRIKIQREQHLSLHDLEKIKKKTVFYVVPFYTNHQMLQQNIPNLLQDTWCLPVEIMEPTAVFDQCKSRIVFCSRGLAKSNPKFETFQFQELDLGSEIGVPVREFAEWYRHLHLSPNIESDERLRRNSKNSWLVRGLRVAIIYDSCQSNEN